jgi:hypothetical protein
MGLDIIAYRKLDPYTTTDTSADGCYVSANEREFESRADGIATGVVYRGCAAEFHFRAGSYSGYNEWREQLAKLAGYPAATDIAEPFHASKYGHTHSAGAWIAKSGPFWELITFSDCNGTIGPQTSSKLLMDFITHQKIVDEHPDEWFRELYAQWRHAFELAADAGAVVFC